MSFIQRELDRLAVALQESHTAELHAQLYTASQALSWALEPGGFKYPYDMIMGTEADSAGYLLSPHQLPSLKSCDH
jgi:hypothetical protein